MTLGTGTVTPHRARVSAAHYVEADGRPGGEAVSNDASSRPAAQPPMRLLLDCGAGALHRMAEFGVPWRDLTHIAITHFHADHWGELGALIFAMKYGALEPRTAPLTIYGPEGMRERLAKLAAAFGDWVLYPGFHLEVVEVIPQTTPHAPLPGVEIAACKTPHTPESIAYSVATSARHLVYTGDTGPSDELGDFARDCDLLLSECSLPDSMAMDLHLTPRQAGRLAARAHAKRLVLTHLYPPVEAVDIVAEAQSEYGGPVTVARDGDFFEI